MTGGAWNHAAPPVTSKAGGTGLPLLFSPLAGGSLHGNLQSIENTQTNTIKASWVVLSISNLFFPDLFPSFSRFFFFFFSSARAFHHDLQTHNTQQTHKHKRHKINLFSGLPNLRFVLLLGFFFFFSFFTGRWGCPW